MKQIIIIHGGDCFATKEDFYQALKNRDYNPFKNKKRRRDRIAEQLEKTHQTMVPIMPNKFDADYIAWKIRFERHFPFLNNEDIILIGSSLGGNFLAKYLSENTFPKKIKQLHLVAPSFDQEGFIDSDIGNFSFDPNNLKNILTQAEKIFLYQSKDDPIVPFSQSQKYIQYLPESIFQEFEDRGHFQQETFPELLKNIKNN